MEYIEYSSKNLLFTNKFVEIYLLSQNKDYWNNNAFDDSIKKNDIEKMKLLKMCNCPFTNSTENEAIKTGNIDILNLLKENGLVFSSEVINNAIIHKKLEVVKWLINLGYQTNELTISIAILFYDAKILPWLLNSNYKFDNYSFCFVVAKQNLDLIKYVVNRGCKSDTEGLIIGLIKGNIEILNYLKTICTFDKKIFSDLFVVKNKNSKIETMINLKTIPKNYNIEQNVITWMLENYDDEITELISKKPNKTNNPLAQVGMNTTRVFHPTRQPPTRKPPTPPFVNQGMTYSSTPFDPLNTLTNPIIHNNSIIKNNSIIQNNQCFNDNYYYHSNFSGVKKRNIFDELE